MSFNPQPHAPPYYYKGGKGHSYPMSFNPQPHTPPYYYKGGKGHSS